MILVTVDFGTYSLKIVESKLNKKNIPIHLNHYEIPVSQEARPPLPGEEKDEDQILKELPLLKEQLESLRPYFEKLPENTKTVFQIPIDICSSRFIEVPIKQKKKAQLMVPFKLEEDIPFSLADINLCTNITKTDEGFYRSVASFVQTQTFESYYKKLKNFNTLPTFLTSEASCWSLLAERNSQVAESEVYCILNIGHTKTIAYYFQKGTLVSYNISYSAGKSVDEMIKAEYGVDSKKAREFKHKNAFFLLESQYADVDTKQREFGEKMANSIEPLVQDFKRWELSFRLNYGENISKVFITGGSARIKNIENFLAHHLKRPVEFLDDVSVNFQSMNIKRDKRLGLANANALSYFFSAKNIAHNFLTGIWANKRSGDFPIHSVSFLAVRLMILTIMISSVLIIKGYFLGQNEKKSARNVQGIMSRPSLGLTQREKISLKKFPKRLLQKIDKKRKIQEKEYTELSSNLDSKSMQGLFLLSEKIKSPCQLTSYNDDSKGSVSVVFQKCSPTEILNLENSLKTLNVKIKSLNAKTGQGSLEMSFKL
jgi:Tfp pilus assembly PilM family ATPase